MKKNNIIFTGIVVIFVFLFLFVFLSINTSDAMEVQDNGYEVEELKFECSMKLVDIDSLQYNVEEDVDEEPVFNVTDYERTLLMRLLYCEACTCKSYQDVLEQRAIISVVFNRLNLKKKNGGPAYGYSIYDVVYYQYPDGSWAFTPAGNGGLQDAYEKSKPYQEELYEQVDYVVNNGITIPDNVLYFCSNSCYENSNYFRNNHTVFTVYDDTTFLY